MSLSKVNRQTGDLTTVAGTPSDAIQVAYNNTNSGLAAGNVQSAIDEVTRECQPSYGFKRRRFICIGDSYSIGQNPEHPSGGLGWPAWLQGILQIPSADFYIPQTEEVGSLPGFYPTSGTHKSFKDQLITIESRVENLDTITDIVVAGGYNDAAYADTEANRNAVSGGIEDFVAYINAHYTNVTVWVGCIGVTTNLTRAGFNLALDIPYLYRRCTIRDPHDPNNSCNLFKYIDNCETSFRWYKEMSSDKIHPTQGGYLLIAYTLASAIKQNHGDDFLYGWCYEDSNWNAEDFGVAAEHWFENALSIDPSSNFPTKYGRLIVFEQIKNGMAFMQVNFGCVSDPTLQTYEYPQEAYWDSAAGVSLPGPGPLTIELFRFTSGLIIPTAWAETAVVVPAAFYTEWSGGQKEVVGGNYIVSNYGVKVTLDATRIVSNTGNKLTRISLSGFSCTFPAAFA